MNKKSDHRILITGGAGFIGSHLTDRLVEEGYSVTVIDNLINGSLTNLETSSKYKNFKFIKGNILNDDDLQKAVKGNNIIFHLACLGVRHSLGNPFENQRVNAEGTLKVLIQGKKSNIKKFFYISSSEIYGKVSQFPIKETYTPYPLTIYGASKLAGENYCQAFGHCYGLKYTILRIFNNYGPRSHFEGDAGELIPRTIINILHNKKPVLFGDGRFSRDFIYVKDTARALSDLINNEKSDNMTINIASGREITVRKTVELIMKLLEYRGKSTNIIGNRPADVPRLVADINNFTDLTKFKVQYGFENGLKETIKYFINKYPKGLSIKAIAKKNWKIKL